MDRPTRLLTGRRAPPAYGLLAACMLAVPLALPGPAVAADPRVPPQLAQAATDAYTQAEVRRVDRDGRKITLKHGEIKSLAMPPMTMVFQVSDPAMLDTVKAGDTVRFKAIERSGTYVVTALERAP
jgi:Cu/Ag efflux protein CusF